MNIFQTYANHPGKVFLSIVFLIVGLITAFKFQNLNLPNIKAVFEVLTSEQDKTVLYSTWFLNIASAAGICALGISWLKDFRNHSYEVDPTLNAIVCFTTGLLLLAFSLQFIFYLFSSLLGLILIVGIALLIMFGNDNHQRSYRY